MKVTASRRRSAVAEGSFASRIARLISRLFHHRANEPQQSARKTKPHKPPPIHKHTLSTPGAYFTFDFEIASSRQSRSCFAWSSVSQPLTTRIAFLSTMPSSGYFR